MILSPKNKNNTIKKEMDLSDTKKSETKPTITTLADDKNTAPKLEAKNIIEPIEEEVKVSSATKHQEIDYGKAIQGAKLAMIGNVDSGKSTLVGVLTKGLLDDGRGSARMRVFNYPHEASNGRTSSIAHEIMGFDKDGKQILPDRFNQNKNKYWHEIVKKSHKVVTLIDLCGHEKYLKTTMFGLVGLAPDYSMIIIGSNMGISRMTKEHLGISLALKIPFLCVLTKIDVAPQNVFQDTLETLLTILKSPGVNRRPIIVKTVEDAKTLADTMGSDRICPIFSVSSVTNEGVDVLTTFMGLLKPRTVGNKVIKPPTDPVQYDISEHFLVSGVGIVVSGIVKSGTIKPNSTLLLGPDKANVFRQVVVKSIHVNRVSADEAFSGQFACLAIRPLNKKDTLAREDFRKGMIIIDPILKPDPTWEFEAEVIILHHATTIQIGYQSVLHVGVVRQTVTILDMNITPLRTGDKGLVRFRFMYNTEYLKPGSIILLREGRTKICGVISRVFDPNEKKDIGNIIAQPLTHGNPLTSNVSPKTSPKGIKKIEIDAGKTTKS